LQTKSTYAENFSPLEVYPCGFCIKNNKAVFFYGLIEVYFSVKSIKAFLVKLSVEPSF